MSEQKDGKKPKAPSAAEIEAQLQAQRQQLANTVDELTSALDPRANIAALKEQLSDTAANAKDEAQAFVSRIQQGDQRAIQGVAAALTAVVGLAGIILIRRSK